MEKEAIMSDDKKHEFMQNRELSWLEFNRRVLQEGCDPQTPLLERYKFISIFTSNLDEFFRVRVGSLQNLADLKKTVVDNKTGWTAQEQLDAIFERVPELYQERDRAMEALRPLLAERGMVHKDLKKLSKKEASYLDSFYQNRLLPILSPLIIDARHPFPHLTNQQIYIFSDVSDSKGNPYFGIIGVPTVLDPIVFFPNSSHYVLLEEIIKDKVATLFQGFKLESLAMISITRNADINLDEEIDDMDENIRQTIKKSLRKRNRLAAVRLEIQGELPKSSVDLLLKHHNLSKKQVFYSASPLRMKYVFAIENHIDLATREQVCYRPFQPQEPMMFDSKKPIMDQIFESDKLLHYPYESMDPFLDMLKEASRDPSVVSIRITIYRMATVSKVAEYLAQAAENGKEVLALMELRARFDEENNIDYSERLEQAGCTIIYGFESYKVHSKICLITCYRDNKVQTITQIGTGNYNEKTAKQYTDLAFFTANPEIGQDAISFFNNMLISNLEGQYKHLLVAPTGIKPALMNLFDREIARAKNGEDAQIIIKCNSISEHDLIMKMQEASQAGVKISLIVRGICCLRPQIPGKTDNIRVFSVVGRFLEHHRIYCFGANREDIYISSADLMTRNIVNRVEIAVPIRDARVRDRIKLMLDVFLEDGEKETELQSDGSYQPVPDHEGQFAQKIFMLVAEQVARKKLYNKELTERIDLHQIHRMGEKLPDAPSDEVLEEEKMQPTPLSDATPPAAATQEEIPTEKKTAPEPSEREASPLAGPSHHDEEKGSSRSTPREEVTEASKGREPSLWQRLVARIKGWFS